MRRFILLTTLITGCAAGTCETVSVDAQSHTNAAVIDLAGLSADSVTYSIDGVEEDTRAVTGDTVTLLGLPALSEIVFTLFSGGEAVCEGAYETNNLPSGMPSVEVTVLDESAISSEGVFLGVAVGQDDAFPFAIDRQGRWRFYRDSTDLGRVSQIEPALDGSGIVLADFSQDGSEESLVRYETMLNEAVKTVSLEGAHHFFTQQADGTIAHIRADAREWTDPASGETMTVVGDTLVETRDGVTTELFNPWDWAEPEQTGNWNSHFNVLGEDWTHANSLRYSAARDSYLFSMANLNTVVEVSRDGEILAELTGSQDYPFDFQHDPHWTDEGTLLVVNHYSGGSAAVEYEVDGDEMTAIWQYGEGEGISGVILGQATRLESGNTLVNFGGAGLIQEVTEAGAVVWEVSNGLGYVMGNGQMIGDIYDTIGQ
jgi:hypothetical protein